MKKKIPKVKLLIAALLTIIILCCAAWGDNTTTETYIEMADNSTFINSTIVKDWNTNGNFNAAGLEPGKTYYFRAKSRNGDGVETVWSSTVSKSTIKAIIYSNNTNTAYANVDDTITLEFTASDKLKELPIVKITGKDANVSIINEENKQYKATYTLAETDIVGTVQFSIEMVDITGYSSSITTTTDGSKVFFYNENAYQNIKTVQDEIDLLENLPEVATQEKRDEIAEHIVDKVITLPDLTVDDILDVIDAIPREPQPNAISNDKANELIEKLIEKAIELAKTNTDLDKIKDVIDNSTLPDEVKNRLKDEVTDRENLNNVVIDDSKIPPVIKLDPLSDGREYRIAITDTETNTIVKTISTPGGTSIEVPELQEGKTYKVKIDIVRIADEAVITTRTFTITIKDITKPEITGIYILNGQLTVLAKDNVKLHDQAYAFRIIQEGENITEIESSIRDNIFNSMVYTVQNSGVVTINYQSSNYTTIKPIKSVITIVKDATGNISYKTVNVTKENESLYGEVPQNIVDQIHYNNNPPRPEPEKTLVTEPAAPKTDIVIVQPVSDTLKEVIEGTLKDSNLTVGVVDTDPNSQKGELTIDIKKNLDALNDLVKTELKSTGNTYYRINVTEKATNRLVYTKLLSSAENIVIPDLQDSTSYIIQIFLVHDGKELAFRTIEKMTYDKTPPVIDQILVKGDTMEVLAFDNVKLHEKAYQYLVNNTIRLSFNEGLDILLAATNGDVLTNSDWASDVWTEKNKLSKLDLGAKVKVIVRDQSDNYTIAEVEVKDGLTNNSINADNPLPIQINDQVSTEDLIQKIINEYNAKNPDEQITYNGDPEKYELTTSNPAIAAFENGRLIAKASGRVIITLKDKTTGVSYRYSIVVSKYAQFDRRIIVQVKSQTELKKAFEKPLYREFLNRPITFAIKENQGNLDGTVYTAGSEDEIVTIVATDGNKHIPLYIVVAKDSYPESNVELIISNVAYVLKKGDRIKPKDISVFYDELLNETDTEYLVTEIEGEALLVEGDYITAIQEGKGYMNVIDLAKNRIEQIDVYVAEFKPTTVQEQEHWAQEALNNINTKGLITEDIGDIALGDSITKRDFLTLLSRAKAYSREKPNTARGKLPLNLTKDATYYYTMDALNNLSLFEFEHVLDGSIDINSALRRDEAAAILAAVFKLPDKGEISFQDTQDTKYQAEIEAVKEAGLMVGVGGNNFRPDSKMTFGELCKMLDNLTHSNALAQTVNNLN